MEFTFGANAAGMVVDGFCAVDTSSAWRCNASILRPAKRFLHKGHSVILLSAFSKQFSWNICPHDAAFTFLFIS